MRIIDNWRERRKAKRKQKMLNSLKFGTDISDWKPSWKEKTDYARAHEQNTDIIEVLPAYYNEDGSRRSLLETEDFVAEWHLEYTGPLGLKDYVRQRKREVNTSPNSPLVQE